MHVTIVDLNERWHWNFALILDTHYTKVAEGNFVANSDGGHVLVNGYISALPVAPNFISIVPK